MSNKVSEKNEKVVYKNDWYCPVIVTETKISDGIYLLTGRRRGCTENSYYGHAFYYLTYGKHSLRSATRKMIESAVKANWDAYCYWTVAKVFKHCQELDLGPYGAQELIRKVTGKFIY